MPPRHDLLFARDFPPLGGGISRWMAAIADHYPPGGLTVSTAWPDDGACTDTAIEQVVDRVPITVSQLRHLGGLRRWSRRAVQLARDPAARFAWCDTIRPAGYAAHWAFRRAGLPYGIMVVGNDILTLRVKVRRSPFKRRIMKHVLGRAAVFVAISQWTAAQCRDLFGELELDASRVRVIPLGTDPLRWQRDAAAASKFREQRSLPAGRWLVTVARLVDYKGIDTVIEILPELIAEFPDLQYAAIGRGPDQARLVALAAAAGVADRVHLLDDVADDELAAAYSLGEIYVGLTRETALDVEGFGISFAEAAACGVPVVATRSGGIPDAVVEGETALLVPPDEPAAAAAALRQLLRDPAAAGRMGAAGRLRVERYLNWDRVVGEMRAIAAELGRETMSS